MRMRCILAGLVELALQVLLGDLHIQQGHADVFMAEQFLQCWEANPQPQHLGRERMPQAVGRYMAGAARALCGLG